MSAAAWLIAVPFAAALGLLVPPVARAPRAAGWFHVVAAAASFVLALSLLRAAAMQAQAAPTPDADALGPLLAVLGSFVILCVAVAELLHPERADAVTPPRRLALLSDPALVQALNGCAMLTLVSGNAATGWIGLQGASLLGAAALARRDAAGMAAARAYLLLCGFGLLLSGFGTLLLYRAAAPVLGAGWPALRWTALAAAAPHCRPGLLCLGFVLLTVGFGTAAGIAPLHRWLPETLARLTPSMAATLAATQMNVALLLLLRVARIAAADPPLTLAGPVLIGGGVLSLCAGALELYRAGAARPAPEAMRPLGVPAGAVLQQNGITLLAFGLGSVGGLYAGLLLLSLQTLARTAAWLAPALPNGHPPNGHLPNGHLPGGRVGAALPPLRGASLAAMAGLPPFGVFAALVLTLAAVARVQPWLAVPVAALWFIGALLLLRQPASGGGGMAAVPGWINLILLGVLGLAMPPAWAAWMTGLAESVLR